MSWLGTHWDQTLSITGALFIIASVSAFAAPLSDEDGGRDLPVPDEFPTPLASERSVAPLLQYSIPTEAHHPTGLTGIDVSHYQGSISWQDVASDPSVRFAYVKATEASTLDRKSVV